MDGELLKLITTVAPSASKIITQLLTVKKNPNGTDISIILLATVIEQNSLNNTVMTEMVTSLRRLRTDMIERGLI